MTSKNPERHLLDAPTNWQVRVQGRGSKGKTMRCSILSPLILFLYRVLNCRRRWRIGRVFIHCAMRLEGGAMWSVTARRIMSRFHGVTVGDYSYGPCFDPAVIPPRIEIGRYVSIAPGVRMIVQNHPLDHCSTHPVFYEAKPGVAESARLPPGELSVGHDVWIGYNAVITPGCRKIGRGAVIGAGTIVTRDVPDYAVVVGNPGRVVRKRFTDDQASQLDRSDWWDHEPATAQRIQTQLSFESGPSEASKERQSLPIASIIIPAHNEESVIGRCLRSITEDARPGEFEIIVVGNGCTDATCDIASGFSSDVRVLHSSKASKVAALNLGDRSASHFPRFYVDADIEISADAIRGACRSLHQTGICAAAPRIAWDLGECNAWVRAFYRAWRLQPYFDNGRLGSGVYALNRDGHERLSRFPDVTADDEYVRRLFKPQERVTDFDHCFIATPPRTLRDLVRIKTRSRRGNQQLDRVCKNRPSRKWGRMLTFATRILIRPHLWITLPIYTGVVLATSWNAARTIHMTHSALWEKDWSSRGVKA